MTHPSDRRIRLCVQWVSFGPYHTARLEALHSLSEAHGFEVIGLETTSYEHRYQWQPSSTPHAFRHVCVFPEATYEEIDPSRIMRKVREVLDQINPDAIAVTSYSAPDARTCLQWCRERNKPAILMTDSKADDAPRVAWREWVKSKLIGLYSAALVAGTPQKAYVEQMGMSSEAIFLGFDVVDNAFFAQGAADARSRPEAYAHLPGLDDHTPYFLASNRLIAIKNLPRLLEAYSLYRKQADKPWRLLLLGDGQERVALEALITRLNLEGVVFCGHQPMHVLPAYFGRAGAFVHASLKDTWGLVVNEAMAAGLPVIVSSKTGCVADLVQEGINGYTFDPYNIDELAQRMTQMAAEDAPRTAMSEASRSIIDAWSPQRFATELWAATQFALKHPRIPRSTGNLVLHLVQRLSRRVHSFHSVRD